MPYVLVGILTLGAGLGADLGLATGPITYAPNPVVTLTITCSESFGSSSLSTSSGSGSGSNLSTSTAVSTSEPPDCVVSGTGSKDLDRCLSKVASAMGTMDPTLRLLQPRVARCENQFGHRVTLTLARAPTPTFSKDVQGCMAKWMAREMVPTSDAVQKALNAVMARCEHYSFPTTTRTVTPTLNVVSACNADAKTVETALAAYQAQTETSSPGAISTNGGGSSGNYLVPDYLESWPQDTRSNYAISISGGMVQVTKGGTWSNESPLNYSGGATVAYSANACDGAK